jgi:ribosomal-protein-alanine N-acetyltransferase
MLDEVIDLYGLDEVEAGTATTNMGSQKVLLKNGFVELRRVNRVMKVQEAWVDGLLFKKIIPHDNVEK